MLSVKAFCARQWKVSWIKKLEALNIIRLDVFMCGHLLIKSLC